MKIYDDVKQLSDRWMELRLGSIGGSSIASAVAKGEGKVRNNLMYRLAGEILSGQKYESYSNAHMERGIEEEPEARDMYEFQSGDEITQIGLVRHSEHKHYSPDALINPDGLAEIKSVIPSVHIETILKNKVPAAYRKQIQWGLYVCERQWCKFISYSPLIVDRPLFVIHVERDEKLIKELDEGADKFIAEMLEIVEKIRN